MTDNIIAMPTPLSVLADRIRKAFERTARGRAEWIEGTIELALAFKEGKDGHRGDNVRFNGWIGENELDFVTKDDRAALLNMAEHIELTRIVLQETQRTSWRWIWLEEIEPRLRHVANTAPPPALPVDSPQTPPESPAETRAPVPENTKTIPIIRRPVPVTRGKQSPIKGLPDSDVVNAYVTNGITRAHFARLYKSKRTRPIWHLLVASIEGGHYGEPNDRETKSTTTLTIIFPWLDGRDSFGRRYDLTEPWVQKLVRDVIFPLLAEKPELKQDSYRLDREINARRCAIEEEARKRLRLEQHHAEVARTPLPANEKPVIAYGVPLWPCDGARYTYDELCHAVWYSGYFLDLQINRGWRPVETAMAARHLTKYVEKLQPGFVQAVRAIFNAYQDNPNGEKQFPSPPVNMA